MDTTKKYRVMCEKMKEIQKKWKPKNGDFFYADDFYDKKQIPVIGNCSSRIRTTGCSCCSCYIDGEKIWLPRQDQLQKMFTLKYVDSLFRLIREFQEFSIKNTMFTSMEQLWLAFVAKEKYNKAWNGKDWIVR